MTPGHEVILGSASPARLSVLRAAGLDPRVLISDVDEDSVLDGLTGAPPEDVVLRLAMAKGDAVVAALLAERAAADPAAGPLPDAVVLTCDSMLLFRGRLSGKPHTATAATAQWHQVRGQSAQLLTGHQVTRLSGLDVTASAGATAVTAIQFADLTDAEVDAYVATGEPLTVAGGFTLDGLGGWFVDAIDGDPSSVVGIGLPTVRRLLTRVGVAVADLWVR
ncbi:MAG: Maf family protein [Gordonia sp. (in: high G+C Gram-positive bacteria)]